MSNANAQQTLGNKLKFKLEMMMMMLAADRNEEAAKMYDQLIAEFDKLGVTEEEKPIVDVHEPDLGEWWSR
jgi:hypothetical protein